MAERRLKPVEWIGSSKADLKTFPAEVQQHMGYALYHAQAGTKHRDAKPLKGLGAGLLEVVSRYAGGSYRTVYAVRFAKAVYVVHAFKKKAKKGIATPKHEIGVVKARLRHAEQHYRTHYG